MPLKKIHMSFGWIYFKKNKKKLTFNHGKTKGTGIMASFYGR
jgi:hypothetical protein